MMTTCRPPCETSPWWKRDRVEASPEATGHRRRRRHRHRRGPRERRETRGGDTGDPRDRDEPTTLRDRSDSRSNSAGRRRRRREKAEPFEEVRLECAIPGCRREPRGMRDTCCEGCERTAGRLHDEACHVRAFSRPHDDRRDDSDDDGPDDDTDDEDFGPGKGRRKGKPGKGKGKKGGRKPNRPSQKARKARRQREEDEKKKWKGPTTALERELVWREGKEFATGTTKAYSSRLRTWDRARRFLVTRGLLRREIPGQEGQLDAFTLKRVVALMTVRGYRSAEFYAAAAMGRHKERWAVSPELACAVPKAKRIATRGRGPRLGRAPLPFPPPWKDSPLARMVTIGIWFLLREVELAALRLRDVAITRCNGKATPALWVAKSKTDIQGIGELVARACVCHGGHREAWCGPCCVEQQFKARVATMARAGNLDGEAPLFVTGEGMRFTKAQTVEVVEDYAKDCGEPLTDEVGKKRFGGHSLRVTGAVLAHRSGLDEPTIMTLGRWGSVQAMRAYLRGAPVVKAARAAEQIAETVRKELVSQAHKGLELPVTAAEWPMCGTGDLVADLPRVGIDVPLKVRNVFTGMLHAPANGTDGPAEGWVTLCGWKWQRYGLAGFHNVQAEKICGRCFRLP